MCAKLRTVAASNNRDHARNHSYYCLLALHIEWCYSSCTSRSWWIAQSTQHHRRGCNRIHLFIVFLATSYGNDRGAIHLLSTHWRQDNFPETLLYIEFSNLIQNSRFTETLPSNQFSNKVFIGALANLTNIFEFTLHKCEMQCFLKSVKNNGSDLNFRQKHTV